MNIRYVTFTGADDNTSIKEMLQLSKKYNFVEWGILFSKSKCGVERYPSEKWIKELVHTKHKYSLNLSAHLCGGYVNDVFDGFIKFSSDDEVYNAFDRIQINCYKERLENCFASKVFFETISKANKPIMVGGDYSSITSKIGLPCLFIDNGICPLFDASGGNGDSPEYWHKPFLTEHNIDIMCGYAGGLGPENIVVELNNINKVVENKEFWIDMESKVRSEGLFDLKKCEFVLEVVKSQME